MVGFSFSIFFNFLIFPVGFDKKLLNYFYIQIILCVDDLKGSIEDTKVKKNMRNTCKFDEKLFNDFSFPSPRMGTEEKKEFNKYEEFKGEL